jgi:hypothetical protein
MTLKTQHHPPIFNHPCAQRDDIVLASLLRWRHNRVADLFRSHCTHYTTEQRKIRFYTTEQKTLHTGKNSSRGVQKSIFGGASRDDVIVMSETKEKSFKKDPAIAFRDCGN